MTQTNKNQFKVILLSFLSFVLLLFLLTLILNGFDEEKQNQAIEELTYFESFSLSYFNRESACAAEETFTQADLSQAKVTVLNGWGPWCTACVNEMPALQALAEEYESKGLRVVGIVAGYFSASASNGDDSIAAVLEALDIRYPILLGDERFAQEVEPTMNNCYPGTWVLDSDGNLITFVQGSLSEDGWRSAFDSWLEGR